MIDMNQDLTNDKVDRSEYDWVKSENMRLREEMEQLKRQMS